MANGVMTACLRSKLIAGERLNGTVQMSQRRSSKKWSQNQHLPFFRHQKQRPPARCRELWKLRLNSLNRVIRGLQSGESGASARLDQRLYYIDTHGNKEPKQFPLRDIICPVAVTSSVAITGSAIMFQLFRGSNCSMAENYLLFKAS